MTDIFASIDAAASAATSPPPARDPLPARTPGQAPVVDIFSAMDDDRRSRAVQNLVAAQGVDPEKTAKALAAARLTGIPFPAAEQNPVAAQDAAALSKNNQVMETSPGLQRFVADNPLAARLAQDDFDNLSMVEKMLRGLGNLSGAFAGGVVGDWAGATLSGAGRFYDIAARGMVDALSAIGPEGTRGVLTSNIGLPDLSGLLLRNPGQTLMRAGEALKPAPADRGFATDVASGLGQFGGQALGSIFMPPVASVGSLFAQGAEAMGQKVQNDNAEQWKKDLATVGGSIVTGVTEKYALDKILGPMATNVRNRFLAALSRIGVAGATEGGQEMAENLLQDGLRQMLTNPDAPINFPLYEGGVGATVGAIARTFIEAALHVKARGVRQQQQATGSEATAQLLTSLDELAKNSKVRQRDTSSYEAFIQSALEDGPVQDLFIDPEALAQAGVSFQELAALSKTAAEQADTAAAGTAIRIPVEEFASSIAGTDLAATLIPHLKTAEDGISQAQATAFMASDDGKAAAAQFEDFLTRREGSDAFNSSRDAVAASVTAQFDATGRFTKDVAPLYGKLAAARYASLAARMGMTPEEVARRFPLRIQAEGVMGDALNQGAVQTDTPEFTNWFGESKAVDAGGKPLVVYHGSPDARFVNEDGIFATMKERMLRWGNTPQMKRDAEEGRAFFFTTSRGVAASYADDRRAFDYQNAEAAVIPAFVSVKNPLEFDAKGKHWREAQAQINKDDFIKAAKKQGHDGVVIRNVRDSYDSMSGGRDPVSDVYVVFSSNQIKHAEKNRGTFDPNDPSILNKDDKRGAYSPSTDTITILKGADLSTALHELGHFFLELQARFASDSAAPQDLRDDMEVLLKWFGIEPEPGADRLAVWNRMTLDQQRDSHEKFARGFELFLFEDKAPSVELRGIFGRFRAWLTSAYRSMVREKLDVQLSPEVRQVMGRMLATEDEIRSAEAARSMGMLFETEAEARKFGVDWEAYQALDDKATEEAISELGAKGMKDMQWLGNAKAKILRELQRTNAERRKEVQRKVAAEVAAMPVYGVWQYITGKPIIAAPDAPAQAPVRLSLAALKSTYGDAADAPWRRLVALRMTTTDGGVNPDLLAEFAGYASGDQMVQDLVAAPTPREMIESLTDQAMLERYGDITSPEALAAAVNEAIHSRARARMVATELKALETATKGAKAQTIPAAAREFAAGVIARMRVRDIKPSQFAASAARAAKATADALKADDIATAAKEKLNQLVNTYATRFAEEARNEAEQARRYFRKFDSPAVRKAVNPEYTDQIDALLERFEFKPVSNKALDERRASLQAWADSMATQNKEVDLPAGLLDGAQRKNYREMTVEELRGLVDTVKQIEHLGREKNKLLTAKRNTTYQQARDALAAEVIATSRGRTAVTRQPSTALGKWFQAVRQFGAAHIKAATWARIFDGGKDGGPWWEYIVRPANERADFETTRRAEATKKLTEIMEPVLAAGKMGGKGRHFPTIGRSLNREGVIAMALNTGNAGNLQRLLDGEGWTMADIAPVLDTLSKSDWEAVQALWDYIGSFKPEIAAKERRIFGKEPTWVEPTPVVTKHGTFRGGYYPIVYDPFATGRAQEILDAEDAKNMLRGAQNSATTRRTFTKERAAEVNDMPLLLTMQGMFRGVNDVIHDLAWHEWLIDVNRLLSSKTVDQAVRGAYGKEVIDQFKTWRGTVASGDSKTADAIDHGLGRIRKYASFAGLAYNAMSALIQPLGITQSIVRLGPKWVGIGLKQYIASPVATTREVMAKSEFMANRSRTQFRELNELENRIQASTSAMTAVQRNAWWMMMFMQRTVDTPTWLGAYEKAMAADPDEERAIDLADQAVREAQGSGMTMDLSAIETGGPAAKLFTVFYSFMNSTLNLAVGSAMTKSKPRFAADLFMLTVLPATLMVLVKSALTPGDKEEDDETFWKKLAAAQFDQFLGLFVLGREITTAGKLALGLENFGDYKGPSGLRVLADLTALSKQTGQVVQGGEFDDAFRKAAINLAGSMFGLPSAQINRTVTGTQALVEGETENPAALVLGYEKPR